MSKKPIAYQAYQQMADSYAAKIDTKAHNAYLERPAMLDLLPQLRGCKVLDAGCGPGVYAEEMIRRGAASIDSFDMSDRMLQLAAKRLAEPISRGKLVLHELDMCHPLTMFEDETYDLVNAPLCCDYVENWRKLFGEFFRVLKPGGHFMFSGGHPSFDAEYFNTKKYFSVEQVSCVWKGFDAPVTVPSYRRSLAEFMNSAIDVGFIVEKVVEPYPTDQFRDADLRRYQVLIHRPCFMCVRVRKPESMAGKN